MQLLFDRGYICGMQTASDRLLDEQYWTEWRASNVSLCQCQFFQPYSPPAKRRAGGNMKTVQSITTICLTALLLLASAFVPAKAEDQAGKAANYVYLPIVGKGFGAPPELQFVYTIDNGDAVCIWDAEDYDPGLAAASAEPNKGTCLPLTTNTVSGVVAIQSSEGSGHFNTSGVDDTYKMYESDIHTRTVSVPMMNTLNFGSLQQNGEDNGKVTISKQMAIPAGQSFPELMRQIRIASYIKKMADSVKVWPVHQVQVMYSPPGIPSDPIFLWEHCIPMKDHFQDGEVTYGAITGWQTDSLGTIYVQMAFSECPLATGKWVPISSIWALSVKKGLASEKQLNQVAPQPVSKQMQARLRMPTGEEVMVIIEVAAVVIGATVIILAAPEVALAIGGWMLVGYTLSTATGPALNEPDDPSGTWLPPVTPRK